MPDWVRAIALVNPLSYQVSALRGLMLGLPTDLGIDFAVLGIAAVAGIAVAGSLIGRLSR